MDISGAEERLIERERAVSVLLEIERSLGPAVSALILAIEDPLNSLSADIT